MFYVAAFTLQWQTGTVASVTIWPTEPKIFTLWPLTEKLH